MYINIPNFITLGRIISVPVIFWLLLSGQSRIAFFVFLAAGISDAVDGYLAKRFNWTSELGKVLDPAADKLLLVTVFICLSVADLVPWWLTAVVLLRDLVIVIGAGVYRLLFGPVRGQPTRQSKLNTCCQILFCLSVVSEAAFGWPGQPVQIALGALAFITTAVSGLDYVLIYSRRAAAVARGRAVAAH